MAAPSSVIQWIPVIALLMSFMTLVLSWWKFGREVHVDDKREMLSELTRCKDRCKDMESTCKKIKEEYEVVLAENRRVREENYQLMQRITKMMNGHKPVKGD